MKPKKKSIWHSDQAIAAYQAVVANSDFRNGKRLDAGETLGFSRAFEMIEAGFLRTKFGLTQWRSVLGAPETGPSWAENTTYRELTGYGDADWVDDGSDDYPAVTLTGAETTQPIRAIGSSFSYTIDEVAKAAILGLDINTEKAELARKAIEQKLDVAMAVGNTARGIPSFVTNASLATAGSAVTASTKTGGGTLWSTYANGGSGAKAGEILVDVMNLAKKIDTNTKFSFGPNPSKVLVVGSLGFAFLKNNIVMDTGYIDESFASFLLRKVPDLKRIELWPQLDLVGTGTKERIFMWIDSPDVVKPTLYVDLQLSTPEAHGFSWKIKARSKTAGVKVKNWAAISYMDSTQP